MHTENARLIAQMSLARLRLRPCVVNKIRELHAGGLADFEIVKHAGATLDAVRLVLKAGT